jgi:hypothetical protein
MAMPHRRQYRIKLVKADGTVKYYEWLSGYDETMDAIRRIARVPGGRYFMQEQNVFVAGESGDPEMTEYPIAPYPSEPKERPED